MAAAQVTATVLHCPPGRRVVRAIMAKRKRWKVGERGPRPVDVHVGGRVRMRRTMLGLSQTKLGEAINLTFQQVQKNECGTNRIGSSRLFELSKVLDVPVSFFFDDMPPEVAGERPGRPAGMTGAQSVASGVDTLTKRETLEFVRAYYRIKSDRVRKRLFELVKTIAKAGDAE